MATGRKRGRRRAVINPHPRLVGMSGRFVTGNESGTAEDVMLRLCLLTETKALLYCF